MRWYKMKLLWMIYLINMIKIQLVILVRDKKRWRANGNADDADFTDLHGFFGMFHF
ncbi:MAG: hypothetical protein RLZZ628_3768 [Bacteroidota bacterium]|jgi:hypothetical protein